MGSIQAFKTAFIKTQRKIKYICFPGQRGSREYTFKTRGLIRDSKKKKKELKGLKKCPEWIEVAMCVTSMPLYMWHGFQVNTSLPRTGATRTKD